MPFKPTSLFHRFFLIIVLPILLLQITTSLIFYKRHWQNVSEHMKDALMADFTAVIFYIKDDQSSLQEAQRLSQTLAINLTYHKDQKIDGMVNYPIRANWDLQKFTKVLNNKIPYKSIAYYNKRNEITTLFQLEHGVLEFEFSSKKFQSPTITIFLSWVVGSALLLIIIAVIFMKNQVRSITNLADAAELLGKGQEIKGFKPSGAKEIKKAGIAFVRMKRRIERQINYRSQLLTHISHDLRTPLTRLKLQTEMMQEKSVAEQMRNDLNIIERMVVCYLNFAKAEGNEKPVKTDLIDLIYSAIEDFKSEKIITKIKVQEHQIKIRKDAFYRAISNIIDNALKHSKFKVVINVYRRSNDLFIIIEDDGPGIPEEEYNKVFQPFYKSEGSEGFGLGLAIVKSIIYSHGGRIKLHKSSLGGLKMKIKMPL